MKKLLSLTLVLVTLLTLAVVPASSAIIDEAQTSLTFFVADENGYNPETDMPAGYIGDADYDFEITIMDATLIQSHIAKLSSLTIFAERLADVNGDNRINVLDVTSVQCYIAQIDNNSNVKKYLCSTIVHLDEELKKFDEIVDIIKEHGTFGGNTAFPVYCMGGIGITDANDGHLYGGDYQLRYEQNYSIEGNNGSLVLSYYMYNEEISSLTYEIEIRIYRGAKILDIAYYVYDDNSDSSEPVVSEYTMAYFLGFDEETEKAVYIFPNSDTLTIDDYFLDKETYDLYISSLLDASFLFCNGLIDNYTDVKLEDLI